MASAEQVKKSHDIEGLSPAFAIVGKPLLFLSERDQKKFAFFENLIGTMTAAKLEWWIYLLLLEKNTVYSVAVFGKNN